jgi:hypothetical protein
LILPINKKKVIESEVHNVICDCPPPPPVTSSGSKCMNKDREGELCFGGVARIKHKVDEVKRNNEHTIFLNAGDFFQVNFLKSSNHGDQKPREIHTGQDYIEAGIYSLRFHYLMTSSL